MRGLRAFAGIKLLIEVQVFSKISNVIYKKVCDEFNNTFVWCDFFNSLQAFFDFDFIGTNPVLVLTRLKNQ